MSLDDWRLLLSLLVMIAATDCGGQVSGPQPVDSPSLALTPTVLTPAVATPGSPPPTLLTNPPPEHREVGILDLHDGPFPATLFGVVNQFLGSFRGQWLMIYAGGDRDPEQILDPFVRGTIRVRIGPVDPSEGSRWYVGEFAVPGSSRWAKGASVTEDRVTSEREDESSVTFDLDTLTFSP